VNQTATGKTHKLRLDVGDGLGQVRAQSVRAIAEGLFRETVLKSSQ